MKTYFTLVLKPSTKLPFLNSGLHVKGIVVGCHVTENVQLSNGARLWWLQRDISGTRVIDPPPKEKSSSSVVLNPRFVIVKIWNWELGLKVTPKSYVKEFAPPLEP